MTSAAAGLEGAAPLSGEAPCPSLDPSVSWDDPGVLRGEIYVADHLSEHAAALARSHGAPSRQVPTGLLWQRFSRTRSSIREAYRVLSERLVRGQEPSPAEEWLLENSHVVEDQIREIEEDLPRGYLRKLPRLAAGAMRGYPHVYGLCLDYLRHTDARVDLTRLSEYVRSYQSVRTLTIGELWAVPIMLRLGLLLTVGTLAAAEVKGDGRKRGDTWANRLLEVERQPLELGRRLLELEADSRPLTPAFLVQLLRRLREHDEPALGVVFDWIALQSGRLGSTPEELAREQHLRQAGDQVSVGNAITSMRAVAALDWNLFFERTSAVEALLDRDPAGAYPLTNQASRDRCRHAVESLARRSGSGKDECEVAAAALELSFEARGRSPGDMVRGHVGYYLVDAGRPELERKVAYLAPLGERLQRLVLAFPSLFYFGLLGVGAAAAWLALAGALLAFAPLDVPIGVLLALLLLPASEAGVSLANAFSLLLLQPRLLARFALEDGIPPELRTLVVVPTLLDSRQTLARLLQDLEVRSLANRDENLHFGLLTDFPDADQEELPGDVELLEAALAGIDALNTRYGEQEQRYFLLHRPRRWNAGEGRFMAWERKRGKLEELNRLLRGARDTSFSVVTLPEVLLHSTRYVITLDADTELPRDVARKLIGTLAHPLNRAEFDARRQRPVRGYGILQPRVGILPLSTRVSRYAAVSAGRPGIDPYTTAVSDVYQDLFGEGSFVGKGIYDVDAFAAALSGRVPENRLLSHDLFEGIYARSALLTDVEVLDEQPASYEIQVARQHRWIRGDWQLLPWLLPRVPAVDGRRPSHFGLIDWWKAFDNLRRSLLAPSLIAIAATGWLHGFYAGVFATSVIAGILLLPIVSRLFLDLVRESSGFTRTFLGGLAGDLRTNALQTLLGLTFLLDQALVALDAVLRTLYRVLVSRRHRLEWTTTSQLARRWSRRGPRVRGRMWLGALLSVGLGALLALERPDVLPWALPVLATWCVAPLLSAWLSRPLPVPKSVDRLAPVDADFLRKTARKTWAFFERFVGEEDHFLPPDNFQQDPRGVVAHRTSPTNIGLYLLSTVAAHDFGFIALPELCLRVDQTLGTIEKLPRREGHILNWYDTQTLRPLEPQYVSTVDSGNLAAYLWTLREACNELGRSSAAATRALLAVLDAVELALASAKNAPKPPPHWDELTRITHGLQGAIRVTGNDPRQAIGWLEKTAELLASVRESQSFGQVPNELAHWLERAERCARAWLAATHTWAPHWQLLEQVPKAFATPPLADVWQRFLAAVDRARSPGQLLESIDEIETRHFDVDHELVKAEINHVDRIAAAGFLIELRASLRRARDASQNVLDELERIAARAAALADGMNFRFLFDESRELFVTGYNVGNARLDPSYYDLLASEARLASLVAIAKGDVPQEHWFRLGRPRAKARSRYSVLSWSGSMFEYLMPLLVTKSYPNTLLSEACESAVLRQREYGRQKRVPWGISESAFNVMDLEMTYQYRAFGVPGLGLKPGLGEDLVIAPYATALAALVDPPRAVQNLRALSRQGLEGPYGFFEAIDYSPTRVPAGRQGVLVKTFMAHHHGMTLVALDNVLHDHVMQERFHADLRVKASELLLEERVPVRTPVVTVSVAATATPPPPGQDWDAMEHVSLAANDPPRVHLLGHGALSTLVAVTGSGALTWKGLDVNRFREDPVFDAGGIYVYIRNLTQKTLWSAGFHPTRQKPTSYEAAFSIDRVALQRRDGDLETVMEIVPSPEHPAEVRRITLTNHGDQSVELDLTSYTEVVLARRQADLAHRAFSSMFIETEVVPSHGAVLARRRPRAPGEEEIWLVQVFTPEDGTFGDLDFDTSRASFIGRGGGIDRPSALAGDAPLSRRTGAVLDPALALQRRTRIQPGQQVRIALTTALATSREEALHLAEIYGAPQGIPRAFELGWADARVELRHLGISATQAHRFQRLLSAVVFPQVALRAGLDPAALHGRGREALWARGLSGDLPILLLRLDQPEFNDICRELLLAHEYWRVNGISVDFVLLNEEPSGYLQPQQEAALDLFRSSHAEAQIDQPGGVFLRRADQITPTDRMLLLSAARVVLTASGGSLSRQLGRAAAARRRALEQPVRRVRAVESAGSVAPPVPRPELAFDNGFGGFRRDGSEYLMLLGDGVQTPAPWCNVMANPRFGALISERGATFTWFENSQRHRLTPWSNDAVADPSGELVYVRDDEDGAIWSPTPEPASQGAEYAVSHGQGYTRFEHTRSELEQELTVFVSPTDSVKFLRLRIKNHGARPRRLTVFGVVEWVLGSTRDATRLSVVTSWDPEAGVIFAQNPFAIFPEGTAFFGATRPVQSFTASREEFFGLSATRARPAALERGGLSHRVGAGLDPCGALEVRVSVKPDETSEVTFVLGHGEDHERARALALRHRDAACVESSFDAAVSSWRELLGTINVKTPDPSLDLLVNHWLLYQVTSCRLWARSGFYQSSGAYGFRDQVQDVLALLHARPELAREHLLRAAARQFVEGDVQHWWHPQTGDGIRSHCSDDMLWLPFATAEYVRITGDQSVLNESIPFLAERPLKPDEDDLYSTPAAAPESASLYEHCVRAIDVGVTAGPHDLPLMRGGDWNDGMNRVGEAGRGESVWLGWFLVKTLREFMRLASARGDAARAAACEEHASRITRAVEAHGWDGTWYLRGYFDDGTPLGTHRGSECRIDAIAQSWAVLAETGDRSRAALAVRESETLLVREQARLMALLWPPFERSEPDPGYIRSYPEGIRENGGQYTHGVLFTLQALARLGEAERAARLFAVLNPVNHALTREDAVRYAVEPYVVAADVYAAKSHLGRGGWTWYTGSAGWMYRILVEDILGLKRVADRLFIEPCVPPAWSRFEMTYRYGKSELNIVVENPEGLGSSVQRVEVGGRVSADHSIPLIDDGRHRHVRVRLGVARLRSTA